MELELLVFIFCITTGSGIVVTFAILSGAITPPCKKESYIIDNSLLLKSALSTFGVYFFF